MKKLLTAAVLSLGLIGTASAGVIEAFVPTDVDGVNDSSGALIFLEYGEWITGNGISFDWYLTDTGDNTVVDSMNIFGPSDTFLSGSTIGWDFDNQKATATNGNMLSWAGLQADWELGASFSYGGDTIYSHDALNGGADLVDILEIDFAGFDLSMSFSDTAMNRWGNSFIGEKPIGQLVKVSDVAVWEPGSVNTFGTPTAVPEPGTIAMFGMALAGLGFARRKKAKV